MSDNASPRPWSVHYGAEIWDANGNMVYNLNGFNRGKKDKENAAIIVDAVNTLAEFEAAHMEFPDFRQVIIAAGQRDAAIAERDELRDLCVLLFDAVKHGNQVVDLPGLWNKTKEVLKRIPGEEK